MQGAERPPIHDGFLCGLGFINKRFEAAGHQRIDSMIDGFDPIDAGRGKFDRRKGLAGDQLTAPRLRLDRRDSLRFA